MSDTIDKKEDIKISETEQVPVSPDIQKEADVLIIDIKTTEDLSKLQDEIIDPELKKVFDIIDGQKELDDGEDKTFVEIQTLMQDHKIFEAATKALGWLLSVFFKDTQKPGLEKYKNIKSGIDFSSLDDSKLRDYIQDVESKINATSSYQKKLKYTYLLSLTKDYIYKRDKKIELDTTSPRQCLQQQLRPGNILLLNKGREIDRKDTGIDDKIATTGIQDATNSVWMHSVIISKIENGIPYIIHSTGTIGTDGKSGVDEVRLDTYLQSYAAADVLVLSGVSADAQTGLTKTVEDIKSNQMGKEYDDGAAIAGLTNGLNNKIGIKKEDKDKVNCVEILAETMAKVYTDFSATADIKTPKDFLLQKNLKPTYLATLEAKSIE